MRIKIEQRHIDAARRDLKDESLFGSMRSRCCPVAQCLGDYEQRGTRIIDYWVTTGHVVWGRLIPEPQKLSREASRWIASFDFNESRAKPAEFELFAEVEA